MSAHLCALLFSALWVTKNFATLRWWAEEGLPRLRPLAKFTNFSHDRVLWRSFSKGMRMWKLLRLSISRSLPTLFLQQWEVGTVVGRAALFTWLGHLYSCIPGVTSLPFYPHSWIQRLVRVRVVPGQSSLKDSGACRGCFGDQNQNSTAEMTKFLSVVPVTWYCVKIHPNGVVSNTHFFFPSWVLGVSSFGLGSAGWFFCWSCLESGMQL